MEKSKNTRDEKDKKKMVIRVGGGGGIGGAIMWGGALAIATLVSVSAIKLRKRRRPTNKTNPSSISVNESKELEMNNNHRDEASNGLQALLQDSSSPIHLPQRSDGKRNMGVIQTDSTSEISTLDDKLGLDTSSQTDIFSNNDKGIQFSGNSKPETNHLFTKNENLNKNESMVTEEVIEVIKSAHADQTEEEEEEGEEAKPQIQLIEGGEEEGIKCDDKDSLIMKMVETEQEKREHYDNINSVEKGEEEEEEEEEDDDEESSVKMGVETVKEDQIALKENAQMQLVEKAQEGKEEFGYQENIFGRDEEAPLEIDQIAEEDNPQLQSIEVDQKDRENTAEKDDKEAETAQNAVEGNPQMKLVAEEEDDFEMENNIVEKVEEAIETAQVDQIEVEDNPKMQFVEAEQEDTEYYDKQTTAENIEKSVETAQIAVEDYPQMKFVEEEEEEEERENYDTEITAKKGEEAVETAQEVDQIEEEDNPKKQFVEAEQYDTEYYNEHTTTENIEKSVETAQVDQIAVEDNPQMKLVKKEEEDADDNEKNIPEKGEETAQADEFMVKEDPQMQLSEEEEDSVDDDDDVEKGEEESLEGTGDSSMESNAEAIWPAESLQEFSLDLKKLNFNNQYLGEKIEEDRTIKPEDQESGQKIKEDREVKTKELFGYKDKSMAMSIKRNFSEHLTPITRAMSSANLSIWIWSSLAALVVLLLMVPLSLSLTQVVKLCLIGFFIVVLSKFHKFEKLS